MMNSSRKLSSMLYKVAKNSCNIWRHSIHTSALAIAAEAPSSKIELVSEKLIKPSSPTPSHLRSYRLSYLDQITTGTYVPFAIFYPKNCFSRDTNTQISNVLEKSLSEILTSYYPFAGRLPDNVEIECNDSGASFSEVIINCPMSEIMSKPNPDAEDLLFPSGVCWGYEKHECLLYVQLSHFSCGGKAISISTSHRICDGCTFTNFLNDWAQITRSGLKPDPPRFNGATLLPPRNALPDSPLLEFVKQPVTNKRYVFAPESLTRLKSQIATDSEVKNPSRAEVVAALLYKCSAAATTSSAGIFKPSNMVHVVNLRQLTTPRIPQNTFGNFYCYIDVSIANEEELKVSRVVNELRKAKTKLFERCMGLKQSQLMAMALESEEKIKLSKEQNLYLSSSFLGYPWWLDFGWGKPEKAIFPCVDSKNVMIQMENYDGGVQVQVTLDNKTMQIFDKEKEILAFASD